MIIDGSPEKVEVESPLIDVDIKATRGTLFPGNNRLIVVVFFATATLAIGVVGMLVGSLAFDLF